MEPHDPSDRARWTPQQKARPAALAPPRVTHGERLLQAQAAYARAMEAFDDAPSNESEKKLTEARAAFLKIRDEPRP